MTYGKPTASDVVQSLTSEPAAPVVRTSRAFAQAVSAPLSSLGGAASVKPLRSRQQARRYPEPSPYRLLDMHGAPSFAGTISLTTGGGIAAVGFGFENTDPESRELAYLDIRIGQSGSPIGDILARVYTFTGAWGGELEPDTLLASSDVIDATTLPPTSGNPVYTRFLFSGVNQITLASGVQRLFVIDRGTLSIGNVVLILDPLAGYPAGPAMYLQGGVWAPIGSSDRMTDFQAWGL